MTSHAPDNQSEIRKLLDDAVKYDWEVEIPPTPPLPNPSVVDAMLALLPKSKAPYKSRL